MEIRPATEAEVEAAMASPSPLLPLGLDMHGCATQQEMNSNIDDTVARGYTPINSILGAYSGSASLVGSAPSIENTWVDLRGDVLAINQAIGVLLAKGVIPKWAMLWDAAECVAEFAVPHPEVTYLVASRCHPAVFERLKDCKVIVWHAGGDHNIADILAEKKIMEPMINGGSAGITRAIFLLHCLGYKDLHIFGADSSYSSDGKTHIVRSLVPEKDMMVAIGNNPPFWFRTTPEWCAQVTEYRAIYAMFSVNKWCDFTVYGDGMLPFMHQLLSQKRELLGDEKFLEQVCANELQTQDLNKAASESLA